MLFWTVSFVIAVFYIVLCSSAAINKPLKKVTLIKTRRDPFDEDSGKFVDGTERPVGYPRVY